MGSVMLSIKDFSKKANLSEAHVRTLLNNGKLIGVKIGKEWRISIQEANKFLGIRYDNESFQKDLYIKDLEKKVKAYEVQLSALKNTINTLSEIASIS